jgi:hypothetical protein
MAGMTSGYPCGCSLTRKMNGEAFWYAVCDEHAGDELVQRARRELREAVEASHRVLDPGAVLAGRRA